MIVLLLIACGWEKMLEIISIMSDQMVAENEMKSGKVIWQIIEPEGANYDKMSV